MHTRGGQGQAQRLEPGLRRERQANAVFLNRQSARGGGGVVACAVAMSASAGGRGPANLSHQSGPGRIPMPSRGRQAVTGNLCVLSLPPSRKQVSPTANPRGLGAPRDWRAVIFGGGA